VVDVVFAEAFALCVPAPCVRPVIVAGPLFVLFSSRCYRAAGELGVACLVGGFVFFFGWVCCVLFLWFFVFFFLGWVFSAFFYDFGLFPFA